MSKLYTPRLLSLSAELANYPYTDDLALTAEARSRTCGSSIRIGLDAEASGAITRVGMLVTACAVGQSSAAILAADIKGRTHESVSLTLNALERWIANKDDLPDWPRIEALEPAREHAGRHAALLLPWQAAITALSTAPLPSATGSR